MGSLALPEGNKLKLYHKRWSFQEELQRSLLFYERNNYTVKYRNIVFDFGNVIGKFDGSYILEQFCSSREDMDLLMPVLYRNWLALDAGTIDYEENIETTAALVPARLHDTVRDFFRRWPEYVRPIPQTYELIARLREKGAGLYLLSNASAYFAGIASGWPVLRDNFNGIVFSAPVKMAKPDPAIYRYLFQTYGLNPEECFFIDDLKENIETGKKLGMDGIIFTGDIKTVGKKIEF